MKIFFSCLILFLSGFFSSAQLIEVQANYTGAGDVDFSAYNYTSAPLFLYIEFADLENTSLNEPLPYVKRVQPGFNTLFTLLKINPSHRITYNHQIKVFRSNPLSTDNIDFPYLLPFEPGDTATVFDVKSMEGFIDTEEKVSWNATGFHVAPNQKIYASRTGEVVEIAADKRDDNLQTWYNKWYQSITLLQQDGTLACYRNVIDSTGKLKVGDKIFAGQLIGTVAPGAENLIFVLYKESLYPPGLMFIIPQFVTYQSVGVLLSSQTYRVDHPDDIRSLEMTKREIRRHLK